MKDVSQRLDELERRLADLEKLISADMAGNRGDQWD